MVTTVQVKFLEGQVPDPSSHCWYMVEVEFDFASDSTLSCHLHMAKRKQVLVLMISDPKFGSFKY